MAGRRGLGVENLTRKNVSQVSRDRILAMSKWCGALSSSLTDGHLLGIANCLRTWRNMRKRKELYKYEVKYYLFINRDYLLFDKMQ